MAAESNKQNIPRVLVAAQSFCSTLSRCAVNYEQNVRVDVRTSLSPWLQHTTRLLCFFFFFSKSARKMNIAIKVGHTCSNERSLIFFKFGSNGEGADGRVGGKQFLFSVRKSRSTCRDTGDSLSSSLTVDKHVGDTTVLTVSRGCRTVLSIAISGHKICTRPSIACSSAPARGLEFKGQ